VRRGESLYAIARRNHMDTRTLMRLNNKQPGEVLRAGERLIVSRAAAGSPAPRAASGSGGASSGKARSLRHTVRSGDTLYRIARLYQVTVAQIVSWNGIAANTPLRPGQKLNINIRQGR